VRGSLNTLNMKVETVSAVSLSTHARLDSRYFLAPGIKALERVERAKQRGIPCVPLGGKNGIARIWKPSGFRKVEASPRESKIGYLRPYDVFEYLPRAADFVSVKRAGKTEAARLKRGMLVQTCSGRNLGPAVFVDDYLAKFVIGSDMIRIEIDDPDLRAYALGYLQSDTGQQLLTQGKTGSVIDHLSIDHVAGVEIPLFDHDVRTAITQKMSEAIRLREEARLTLDEALTLYEESLPKAKRAKPEKEGWTIRAKELTDRLDAASYDPFVANVKKKMTANGGATVASVAKVLKPGGRPKTIYVEPEYGNPVLSGTQLLQIRPIHLSYMPARAYKNPSAYVVRKGMIAYQADGRAEDALGVPVMITSDRDGWFASGHVGRLVSNPGVDPGWLYLACRSWQSQIQLKSLASGSVVDSTFPWDMASVRLPPRDSVDGKSIQDAWEKFARAQRAEDEAKSLVEQSLSGSEYDFAPKLSAAPSPLELEFRELVKKWRKDTQHTSSVKRMVGHPAYKRIIEIGADALPLVFRELNAHRDHWLVALNVITGEDPAPEAATFPEAVDAWLAWGREKGYLPPSVSQPRS
jgi:hypothetical protein